MGSRRRRGSAKRNNTERLLQALFALLLAASFPGVAPCREPSFDPADYDKIPSEYREDVQTVTRFPTIHKVAPVSPFASSVRAYEFLLGDLQLASKLARSAAISKHVVEKTSEGLAVSDGEGMEGVLYQMYAGPGRCLYYAEGTYNARLLPELSGKGVMEITFHLTDDGKVENRVEVWLKLDSKVFGLLGKMLFPIVGKLVKGKTGMLGAAAKMLSERLYQEPEALHEKLKKSGLATEEELAKLSLYVKGERDARPSPAPRPPGD